MNRAGATICAAGALALGSSHAQAQPASPILEPQPAGSGRIGLDAAYQGAARPKRAIDVAAG